MPKALIQYPYLIITEDTVLAVYRISHNPGVITPCARHSTGLPLRSCSLLPGSRGQHGEPVQLFSIASIRNNHGFTMDQYTYRLAPRADGIQIESTNHLSLSFDRNTAYPDYFSSHLVAGTTRYLGYLGSPSTKPAGRMFITQVRRGVITVGWLAPTNLPYSPYAWDERSSRICFYAPHFNQDPFHLLVIQC